MQYLIYYIVRKCSGAVCLLKDATILSSEIVCEFPLTGSYNVHENEIEETSITLAQFLINHPHKFHACGLFDLDFTLLFGLMGFTSYFVLIAIQFLDKDIDT